MNKKGIVKKDKKDFHIQRRLILYTNVPKAEAQLLLQWLQLGLSPVSLRQRVLAGLLGVNLRERYS